MKNLLSRNRVDGIWHFTDRSNVDRIIEQQGLLSWAEINRRGIEVPTTGGNQWSHDADRIKGVDEYVHLAFLDDHPMLFHAKKDQRITDPVWLKVSIDVLDLDGVRYTADVSNKAGVPLLTPEEARQQIDVEVLFTYMDWKDPAVRQRRNVALKSEILIPNLIPINMILGKKNG